MLIKGCRKGAQGVPLLTLLMLIISPSIAYADCTLAGMAICNGMACPGKAYAAGQVIYNADYDMLQTCRSDGTWVALGPIGCPAGNGCPCPQEGDSCPDGTIYAGIFNGSRLYVAANDAPSTRVWGPNPSTSGSGFCTATQPLPASCDTGSENTQILKDHASSFPAAEYCADLIAHGHNDWYLPSYNEIRVVYDELYAGQPVGTHNFQSAIYWSSSEYNAANAWYLNFNSGVWLLNLKTLLYRVRCVRR